MTEEEGSSIGSEFVDATQNNSDANSVDEEETNNGAPTNKEIQLAHDTSVDQIQRNMRFLNESWANMAENVEEDSRLLAALEKEPVNDEDEGFQVQISKAQKKAQKKKLNNRESYTTRSKGPTHKPFR